MDKRRRGRPATGRNPKKTYTIAPSDYRLIQEAAELAGEPTAEFVRQAALRRAKRVMRQRN